MHTPTECVTATVGVVELRNLLVKKKEESSHDGLPVASMLVSCKMT